MLQHEQHSPEFTQSQQDWVSTPNVIRTDKDLIVKDFFTVNNTDAKFMRGQVISRRAMNTLVTGAVYSVATTEYLIGITSLSYAPSIGLPRPSLVGIGKYYRIKDEVGGAATTTITVRSAAEETIDGASSKTITTNYGSLSLYSDGSNWFTF